MSYKRRSRVGTLSRSRFPLRWAVREITSPTESILSEKFKERFGSLVLISIMPCVVIKGTK